MMVVALWIATVLLMVAGHIFKVKRWGLFVSTYEEPSEANLLNAMAFGHTVNTLLPFRVGDIIRAAWAGRKMKNGYSLSFATVIADLFIDVLTVGCIFLTLAIVGKTRNEITTVPYSYLIFFAVALIALILAIKFRKYVKRLIRFIARGFNENIEFWILYESYLCIASLKDIVRKISKTKFAFLTICIWTCYIVSYMIFSKTLSNYGFTYSTADIFTILFSVASFYNIEKGLKAYFVVYLLAPLLICWLISLLMKKNSNEVEHYHSPLPQMNQADKMTFLKIYYEDERRDYIQSFLELNRNVTVIEDKSAGSNASTLLIMNSEGEMFFRKYAFGEDGIKLDDQIEWIKKHQRDIPLPLIAKIERTADFVSYDMHSFSSAVGLFRYIHTMPVDDSWRVLEKCIHEIQSGLHANNHTAADQELIERYIDIKVIKNLNTIKETDKYIKSLERFSEIIVNGKSLHTLDFYKSFFDKQRMTEIFMNDPCADIHGDLTIESVVCLANEEKTDHYFIDPNTGNIHNSIYLDYAKLLQSLHGNYELLVNVSDVSIEKDRVNYTVTNSNQYCSLYERYKDYLKKKFDYDSILSIYYHEVVHWLRLMPYKIRKNEKTAVVFYTGLLMVLNDVWEMEQSGKAEISNI